MKKIPLFILLFASTALLHAQQNWSLGLSLSSLGNHSSFSGGMKDANARFMQNPYGTGAWEISLRRPLNNHFSVQAGFGTTTIGFDFAIAENYSFPGAKDHFTRVGISRPVVKIPATLIYTANPNCRNVRWFAGAGFSLVGAAGSINKTQSATPVNENSSDEISMEFHSSPIGVLNGHLLLGLEKIFKNGQMLSASMVLNGGFLPVATANVSYTIDGQNYYHTFTNYGNYAGLTVTWYFKPFKGK